MTTTHQFLRGDEFLDGDSVNESGPKMLCGSCFDGFGCVRYLPACDRKVGFESADSLTRAGFHSDLASHPLSWLPSASTWVKRLVKQSITRIFDLSFHSTGPTDDVILPVRRRFDFLIALTRSICRFDVLRHGSGLHDISHPRFPRPECGNHHRLPPHRRSRMFDRFHAGRGNNSRPVPRKR